MVVRLRLHHTTSVLPHLLVMGLNLKLLGSRLVIFQFNGQPGKTSLGIATFYMSSPKDGVGEKQDLVRLRMSLIFFKCLEHGGERIFHTG